MNIKVAESAGFCFGVKRAVDIVNKECLKGGNIVTYGHIIHNENFIRKLEKKGVRTIEKLTDLEENFKGTVIVRAHGISEAEEEYMNKNNIYFIDATCPFVKKIHRLVRKASEENYTVIIVGDPEHPEVKGIAGRCPGKHIIVSSAEDAEKLNCDLNEKLFIVSQTTFLFKKFEDIVAIIQKKGYYNINVQNTICDATTKRQSEAVQLAKCCDAMLVIGGKSSSNTNKLYELCRNYCPNTLLIQDKGDLIASSLQSIDNLGITAGASTPHNIIEEVQEECLNKALKKC